MSLDGVGVQKRLRPGAGRASRQGSVWDTSRRLFFSSLSLSPRARPRPGLGLPGLVAREEGKENPPVALTIVLNQD